MMTTTTNTIDRNGIRLTENGFAVRAACTLSHGGNKRLAHSHGEYYECCGCLTSVHADEVKRQQSEVRAPEER